METSTQFFCHGCKRDFSKVVAQDEDIVCIRCGDSFVEAIEEAGQLESLKLMYKDQEIKMEDNDEFHDCVDDEAQLNRETLPQEEEKKQENQSNMPQQEQNSQQQNNQNPLNPFGNIFSLFNMPMPSQQRQVRISSQDGSITIEEVTSQIIGGHQQQMPVPQQLPQPSQQQQQNSQQQNQNPQQQNLNNIFAPFFGSANQMPQSNQMPIGNIFNLLNGQAMPGGNPFGMFMNNFDNGVEQNILNRVIQESLNSYDPTKGIPTSKDFINEMTLHRADELKAKTDCQVCQETFKEDDRYYQLPCKHKFHADCILPWLEKHNTCPNCRKELPTDDFEYENRKKQQKNDPVRDFIRGNNNGNGGQDPNSGGSSNGGSGASFSSSYHA